MIVTTNKVKELIRDHLTALDDHANMYNEIIPTCDDAMKKASIVEKVGQIRYGMNVLRDLLQNIEALEELPLPESLEA